MVGKKWIDHCLSSLFEVCLAALAHDSCYTSVRPTSDSKSHLSPFLVGILMVIVWLTRTPQKKLLGLRSLIYTPSIYSCSFQALGCGSFQEKIILFISWIPRIGPVWTKEVSPLPGHSFFICPLSKTESYKNPKVLAGDSLWFQELSLKQ